MRHSRYKLGGVTSIHTGFADSNFSKFALIFKNFDSKVYYDAFNVSYIQQGAQFFHLDCLLFRIACIILQKLSRTDTIIYLLSGIISEQYQLLLTQTLPS